MTDENQEIILLVLPDGHTWTHFSGCAVISVTPEGLGKLQAGVLPCGLAPEDIVKAGELRSEEGCTSLGPEMMSGPVSEFDLLGKYVEEFASEAEHLRGGETCDHSVGICWCDYHRKLRNIKTVIATLRARQFKKCSACNGDGHLLRQDEDGNPVSDHCGNCDGIGTQVTIPTI
jgi:hypothetical protein